MELFQEMLISMRAQYKMKISFTDLTESLDAIVHDEAYRALVYIRDIVRDETLSDAECFRQIEEIICLLEKLGSDGGLRHDL